MTGIRIFILISTDNIINIPFQENQSLHSFTEIEFKSFTIYIHVKNQEYGSFNIQYVTLEIIQVLGTISLVCFFIFHYLTLTLFGRLFHRTEIGL